MRLTGRIFAAAATAGILGLAATAAYAAAPTPWQLGMQPAATPVQEEIAWLHNIVLWLITLITIFVLALLLYVVTRFSAKRNPKPSTTSHNTSLEIAWTLIPVMILVGIAVPSFRLVYMQDRTERADLTVKVTGHQWYWEYEYPDHGGFKFDSRMIPENEIRQGQIRLLSVDNEMVVPAGRNVRVLTTSVDVIHSFYVPSFGVQKYNIPGRTLETWFRADRPGMYYGQCNQICGTNHAYMPIAIRVVPEAEFQTWVGEARRRFAATDAPATDAPATGAPTAAPPAQLAAATAAAGR
ncbi:MAG: cytochrome c oxidase subunit II [Alphaproteobacteria bacterium]|nr:cytochrome c oxidase subunit II [Alphaproteobacteria bacterium]